MRIAVLDDDLDEVFKLHEMIFHISGNYRVDRFTEGKDLLKEVESGAVYDLLFCDVYMKGENGIEIAKQMKTLCPQTPVAFITSSREHAVDAFSVDAVHYLVKPVTQEAEVETKSASTGCKPALFVVLQGNMSKTVPKRIIITKLSKIICVGLKRKSFSNLSKKFILPKDFRQIKT